ncbi:unnamed protein product [Moneuplotes crassus]|uniref:Uncharacterized protein n=1 Tax=Euplotes crassus TaxID=5936 RepID=A0AAD2D291_EUPCR|nr:unnamed protein product [Moneuplotes crassus]
MNPARKERKFRILEKSLHTTIYNNIRLKHRKHTLGKEWGFEYMNFMNFSKEFKEVINANVQCCIVKDFVMVLNTEKSSISNPWYPFTKTLSSNSTYTYLKTTIPSSTHQLSLKPFFGHQSLIHSHIPLLPLLLPKATRTVTISYFTFDSKSLALTFTSISSLKTLCFANCIFPSDPQYPKTVCLKSDCYLDKVSIDSYRLNLTQDARTNVKSALSTLVKCGADQKLKKLILKTTEVETEDLHWIGQGRFEVVKKRECVILEFYKDSWIRG